MADFVSTISTLGHAVKIVKDLNQIDRELDKAELKLKIAELSGALATAQITLSEAQQEASSKDAQIQKLTDAFKEKADNMVEHEGFHYRKGPDGKPHGKPYCNRCLQNGKLFMMTTVARMGRPAVCAECKSEYQDVPIFAFHS